MNALLFDMDGVLVDVSRSQLRAVRILVSGCLGRPVEDRDIQAFRAAGGLNNDWDLCEVMIRASGVLVDRMALIERFQDLYRGPGFDGLIRDDVWLLRLDVLASLRPLFRFGIVTGRPRAEAVHALERSGASDAFDILVAGDDIPAGRSKPDPLGLTMALAGLSCAAGYYVGDTVDDVAAALAAGLAPVGVCGTAADPAAQRRLLLARGAAAVIESVNDIPEVVS